MEYAIIPKKLKSALKTIIQITPEIIEKSKIATLVANQKTA